METKIHAFNNNYRIISIGLVTATVAYFFDETILGSGKDVMNQLLFTNGKHITWQTMISRIIESVLSFSVSGAGGIFAPSLAAGATIGGFLSSVFGIMGTNANILILSGMVGFLTGITRTPFTCAVLVLEMTDRHSVIFYLMLAAMVSNIAATIISKRSFYDHLKGAYLKDAKKKRSLMNAIEASKDCKIELPISPLSPFQLRLN